MENNAKYVMGENGNGVGVGAGAWGSEKNVARAVHLEIFLMNVLMLKPRLRHQSSKMDDGGYNSRDPAERNQSQ